MERIKDLGTQFVFRLNIGVVFLTIVVCGCGASVDIWTAIETEDLRGIEKYHANGGDLEAGKVLHGKTPLLHAIQLGKRKAYEKLLQLGASPNTICRGGWAVMYEASDQDDVSWLELALKHGGNANLVVAGASDQTFKTPLECAISHGHLEAVRTLVEHRADLELIDPIDGNALSISARRLEYEIAYFLLEHGANYKNPSLQKSMFLYVVQARMRSPIVIKEQAEWFAKVIRWLNDHGVKPEEITIDIFDAK